MGMDKSGTQDLSANSTWIKLTGFTVRAGYPATNIVDSELVIDVNATGDISFRGTFSFAYGTQQFRVVLNGTTVLGSPANTGVTGTILGQSLSAGDTLELQAFASETWIDTVNAGATDTFLVFDQTSQEYEIEAEQEIGWDIEAAANITADIGADQQIGWDIEAAANMQYDIEAEQTIGWDIEADLYLGQFYDIEASRNIGWNIEAEFLHIHKPEPPQTSWEDITATVHTVDGRGVDVIPCSIMSAITWGREQREVSVCDIDVMTEGDPELLEDLRPWVHWVTVWHGERPVWTGPIQSIRIGRVTTKIAARDPSTFMWRTRVPVTRTWADTDPTGIAASVLASMNDLHHIDATPIVLPGITESFTYHADADSRMVHQLMDDLTKLGLEWTVVAGRFILGAFSEAPVAELAECDFLVDIDRLRDGSGTFNDVRIQGQNWAQTARAPLAGLNLQTLVSLDDVFGVSNIQKAARLYAQEVAAIRDVLVVPSGASLHPEADVRLDDLVPGKVFKVSANGIANLMKVDQVQVSATPGTFDTQVTLVAVQGQGELAELVQGGG